MRSTSASLFALVGFLTVALLGWSRGAPAETLLLGGLVALALFGGLGYVVGIVGERIVAELMAHQESSEEAPVAAKPEEEGAAPASGAAVPAAPAPRSAATRPAASAPAPNRQIDTR